MSVMCLKEEIYSRVVASLRQLRHALPDLYADFGGPEGFVDVLRLCNALAYEEAYEGRHGDADSVDLGPVDPAALPYPADSYGRQIDLHKIMRLIDYQCVDSTAYREDRASAMVASICDHLSSEILRSIPEYDNARPWA